MKDLSAQVGRPRPCARPGGVSSGSLELYGSGSWPEDMRHLEYTAESVRFEINCRNQAARTEYLYFETKSLLFAIMSSHAGVDFREDASEAFKYMHLDFIVVEAQRPQSFTGRGSLRAPREGFLRR